MTITHNRRQFVAATSMAMAGAALAGPALAQGEQGQPSAAAQAFLAAHAGAFDKARRLAFLLPEGLAIVHDVPFPLDHAGYADHLEFHRGNWDAHEWIAESVETVMHGVDHAVVSCYFNERGKPRDAGFRLRPGFATATCVRTPAGWKALSVHFSSLRSQVLDASPS